MLVLLSFLISRLIIRSGLRISHSKVFSSGEISNSHVGKSQLKRINWKKKKTLISNSNLIRQSFQGYCCESIIAIFVTYASPFKPSIFCPLRVMSDKVQKERIYHELGACYKMVRGEYEYEYKLGLRNVYNSISDLQSLVF